MDKAQAIHAFWSRFGVHAYDQSTVPASAEYPWLTYDVSTAQLGNIVALSASLWYHSTSWAEVTQKADEIGAELGWGGLLQPYDGGTLWVVKGTPFTQRMTDPDGNIRRIVINVTAEFLGE